ncbi:hypothetical protein CDL12_06636 [Handroanthus impetiginosus]|uniref:Non-specific lipid-transfer protein n=1 Tax=Handroanthus impetiginosus TaxID=429701 RepID=A0A2G9HT29_9LAMI|nr:hypothetical protein CDL12_06636 [Handroanthus impetiginosus]
MKSCVAAIFALVALVLLVSHRGEAMTCGRVDVALAPCIGYLTGRDGDTPSPRCCAGVKAVKEMAQTTADKRACCSCVKDAANRHQDLKDAAAQSLPAKCDVQMDIIVSRDVNCDKIN